MNKKKIIFIQSTIAGECWAVPAGSIAESNSEDSDRKFPSIGIQLSQAVDITSFSIDHISYSAAPLKTSAPRIVELFGVERPPPSIVLLLAPLCPTRGIAYECLFFILLFPLKWRRIAAVSNLSAVARSLGLKHAR